AAAGAAHVVGVNGFAVGGLDAVDFGGGALSDHGHALGEPSVAADNGLVARFQGIDHRGLNPAGAGSGDGIGHAVVGLEDAAQQCLYVSHHFDEPRVHVAH